MVSVIILLLVPMAILYTVHTNLARFLTIGLSTLAFTTILTLATAASKAHIFAAAAGLVPGNGSLWNFGADFGLDTEQFWSYTSHKRCDAVFLLGKPLQHIDNVTLKVDPVSVRSDAF
jgi:hypothetical protein